MKGVYVAIRPCLIVNHTNAIKIVVGYPDAVVGNEFKLISAGTYRITSFMDQIALINKVFNAYEKIQCYIENNVGQTALHIVSEFKIRENVTFYWENTKPGFTMTREFRKRVIEESPWKNVNVGNNTADDDDDDLVSVLKHFAYSKINSC